VRAKQLLLLLLVLLFDSKGQSIDFMSEVSAGVLRYLQVEEAYWTLS
jgi:hypothetical protein